jgi:autophagy-related protein 11
MLTRSRLDDLKSWVAENSSISAQHVVALTAQGRSVKLASLHGEVKSSLRVTEGALTAW